MALNQTPQGGRPGFGRNTIGSRQAKQNSGGSAAGGIRRRGFESGGTQVYSEGGKVIGNLDGRTFKKWVDGSKHFLRNPPAIALDMFAFDQREAEFDAIEVHDRETGTTHRLTKAEFNQHRFEVNRGFGRQWAVRLGLWHVPGVPAAAPPAQSQTGKLF